IPDGGETPRPGDFVTVPITESYPYHLIADPVGLNHYALRRSRAGDAWDRTQAESCGTGADVTAGGVNLGLPSLRTSVSQRSVDCSSRGNSDRKDRSCDCPGSGSTRLSH